MNVIFALFLTLLPFAEMQRPGGGSSAQQRELVVRFLEHFAPSPLVRPDGRRDKPLKVKVNYDMTRIIGLDVERGILRMAGYLAITWTDRRLSYERILKKGRGFNITSVRLDATKIWIPDIEPFNTDSPSVKSLAGQYLVVAEPSGDMTWVPQVAVNTFCDRDQGDSTFNCTLRFGSWTFSANDFNLQVDESADLGWTFPNRQWRVGSSSVQRVAKKYSCCPEHYLTADYNVILVRQ